MLKKSLVLFCFVLYSLSTLANQVDDLKTNADVQKFIGSIDTGYIAAEYAKKISIVPLKQILKDNGCDPRSKNWKIKSWVKVDFNNDKRTDLLAICYLDRDYYNFIAIDNGNNTFKLIKVNYNPDSHCELINTIKKNGVQLLLFHTQKITFGPKSFKSLYETDTLLYKFNGFIELNHKPAHYRIDAITLRSGGPCVGSCPPIEINIDPEGNAVYKTNDTLKYKVSKNYLDRLYGLINYIAIKKLKNNYAVNWTDWGTCKIIIKFSDGSIKEINDYGGQGTFGLEQLYSLIYDSRKSKNWAQIKP